METSHSPSVNDFKPLVSRRWRVVQETGLSVQDEQQSSKYKIMYFDLAFVVSLLILSLLFAVRFVVASTSLSPFPLAGVVTGLTITAAFVVASAWIEGRFRMRVVALLLRGFALFTIGAMGSGFMSTTTYDIGHGIAFKDSYLLAADQLLGFDWLSYVKFVDAHAWLNALLYPAYQSIGWQPAPILLILAFRLDCKAVYAFLTVEFLGFAVVSLLASFVPCLGVAQFFGLVLSDHPHMVLAQGDHLTAAILSLQDATRHAPLGTNVALGTFPSFQAVSAVLYIWAWWRVPIARYFGFALNVAMLFAIPLHGSDYLVDVIAGGLIAASLLHVVSHMLGLVTRRPGLQPLSRKARLHRCIPAMS